MSDPNDSPSTIPTEQQQTEDPETILDVENDERPDAGWIPDVPPGDDLPDDARWPSDVTRTAG